MLTKFIKNLEKKTIYHMMHSILHHTIIILTIEGFSEQEIIEYLIKIEKDDFESLEEKDQLLVLSIRQNKDHWIESLNLFLKNNAVEKRKK